MLTVFEPARLSMEELSFVLDHLEESPNVALHGSVPKGVNPTAIRTVLGRFAELEELAKVRKVPWAGYDRIKDSIERFIAFQNKCVEGQTYGEPRHPSMMNWDSTGAMSRGGVGSDASDMVRTELLPDGTRKPFSVTLVDGKRRSSMWGKKSAPPAADDKIVYQGDGTYKCTICDKVVASFDVDRGTRAKNAAKKQVRDHCMKAKREHSRHRAILNVPIQG